MSDLKPQYDKEKVVKRLKPMLLEAYQLQVNVQQKRFSDAKIETDRAVAELKRIEILRDEVDNNLSRCHVDDVKGLHCLFFGRES